MHPINITDGTYWARMGHETPWFVVIFRINGPRQRLRRKR